MIKLFVATKAFVSYGGKILILREAKGYAEGTNTGFFDVPGGRVNPGERFDECLKREVKEETGLEVSVGRPFFVNEWRPVVKGEQWQVVGIFFECITDAEDVILGPDHSEYKWIDPKNSLKENLIPSLHTVFDAYLKEVLYAKN